MGLGNIIDRLAAGESKDISMETQNRREGNNGYHVAKKRDKRPSNDEITLAIPNSQY